MGPTQSSKPRNPRQSVLGSSEVNPKEDSYLSRNEYMTLERQSNLRKIIEKEKYFRRFEGIKKGLFGSAEHLGGGDFLGESNGTRKRGGKRFGGDDIEKSNGRETEDVREHQRVSGPQKKRNWYHRRTRFAPRKRNMSDRSRDSRINISSRRIGQRERRSKGRQRRVQIRTRQERPKQRRKSTSRRRRNTSRRRGHLLGELQDKDDLEEEYWNRFKGNINQDETQHMRSEMKMMLKEFPRERYGNEEDPFEDGDDEDLNSEEQIEGDEEQSGREEKIKKRGRTRTRRSKTKRRSGAAGPRGNGKTIKNENWRKKKSISGSGERRANNSGHYMNRNTDDAENQSEQRRTRGDRRVPSPQPRKPKRKGISSRGNRRTDNRNAGFARNRQSQRPYRTREMGKGNAMQKEDNFVESFMDQMFSSRGDRNFIDFDIMKYDWI